VRPGAAATLRAKLKTDGATVVSIDYDNPTAPRDVSAGCVCVVSALNGLEPLMIGMQGRLLDAAIADGMARFIPSDFELNFSKTRPGDNTDLDLRRMFMDRVDRAPIRATSVLTGAFADVLARGGGAIILCKKRKILYWSDADKSLDFTAKTRCGVCGACRPR
jgi:hypothetical protein